MEEFTLKNGKVIVLRKAHKSDGKAMLEYVHKIGGESEFLTFGQGEFTMTLGQEENFIDNISKQSNALFLIAEWEGKIVGNLHFSGGARARTAHTGELGLSVLKEYWGQGIGTKLMTYLIQWCKGSGIIRKINLRVRRDNHTAISLYKKLGFYQEGLITRDFFMKGTFYDSLFMGLMID